MENKKAILITGASGGIGKAIALDLLEKGFPLALHYHKNANELEALKSRANELGVILKIYQADIADETQVEKMISNVCSDFSDLGILINNAGISRNAITWKMSIAAWQESLSVNLTGPFLTMKHILPYFKQKQWGRVINISSVVAQSGVPGTSAYSASKSGLFGLTKTVAKEVATDNISVNTLVLGYFDVGMLYQVPEDIRENIKENIPAKSFGNTNTITRAIQYLISDDAGYVTGQMINLNGGLY